MPTEVHRAAHYTGTTLRLPAAIAVVEKTKYPLLKANWQRRRTRAQLLDFRQLFDSVCVFDFLTN